MHLSIYTLAAIMSEPGAARRRISVQLTYDSQVNLKFLNLMPKICMFNFLIKQNRICYVLRSFFLVVFQIVIGMWKRGGMHPASYCWMLLHESVHYIVFSSASQLRQLHSKLFSITFPAS